MKEVYAVIIFSIVVLLTGNINLNKERMKYLKTIDEFKKTNEQLFSDASKYAKLFGLDSAGSSSEDGKDKGSNSKSSGKGSSSSSSSGSSGTSTTLSSKSDIGNYGKFTEGSSKKSPLVVVFGGINVGGKKSGEYMYDYLSKVGTSANMFVATDHNVNGKSAYDALKNKLSEKSIVPSKKILYLFSGGYNPGMELLKSVGASEFDLIYLVDIWMGNSKVASFYEDLAKNNVSKVRYFYTGTGAANANAKNNLIKTLNFYKANDNNDHMATNKDAVSDLLNKL
jgi:hypothetical protein